MSDTERNGVFHILNAISVFVSDINKRMDCVVLPKEQKKMMDNINEALENMNFFETKEVKEDE